MIVRRVKVEWVADAPAVITEEWSVAPNRVPSGYEDIDAWVRENFTALFRDLNVWGELTLTVGEDMQSCTLVAALCSSIRMNALRVHDYLEFLCEMAARLGKRLLDLGKIERFVFRLQRYA